MDDESRRSAEQRSRMEDLTRRIDFLRQRASQLARGEGTTVADVTLAARMLRTAYMRSREAHEQAARACERAAEAHERAAIVLDRLANAGVGDPEERRRAAERHRGLAEDDRERAAAEWELAKGQAEPGPREGEADGAGQRA